VLVGVLGRWRRGNDRRIDDRPGLQEQPTLLEQRPDLGKDPLGELMRFEQVTESQNGRLVRNDILRQLNARKAGIDSES